MTQAAPRNHLAAALIVALLAAAPAPAARAQDGAGHKTSWWTFEPAPRGSQNYVDFLVGRGSLVDFSQIITGHGRASSDDYMAAFITGYDFGRIGHGALGFEVEPIYINHFGRQTYHEFALGLNARWHDFPWNSFISTTFMIGIGPSYTTEYPLIETDKGHRSHWLNMFNIEFTFALPRYPHTQLVARLQHRSGIFGLINNINGGSDFTTVGLKVRF